MDSLMHLDCSLWEPYQVYQRFDYTKSTDENQYRSTQKKIYEYTHTKGTETHTHTQS